MERLLDRNFFPTIANPGITLHIQTLGTRFRTADTEEKWGYLVVALRRSREERERVWWRLALGMRGGGRWLLGFYIYPLMVVGPLMGLLLHHCPRRQPRPRSTSAQLTVSFRIGPVGPQPKIPVDSSARSFSYALFIYLAKSCPS